MRADLKLNVTKYATTFAEKGAIAAQQEINADRLKFHMASDESLRLKLLAIANEAARKAAHLQGGAKLNA